MEGRNPASVPSLREISFAARDLLRSGARMLQNAPGHAETPAAFATGVSADVRPKGLEPLTF